LRKTPTIALGLIASLALAGGAAAQSAAPSHTLKVSASPSKAGKKTKPKAVSSLKLNIENDAAANTTAKRIEIQLPKDWTINTKGFDTCSASKVETQGADTCPKGSKLGKGTAKALLGPGQSPLNFTNVFYVGSAKSLTIYLEQKGGDVKAILVGKIKKTPKGPKITIDIPEDLQNPVKDPDGPGPATGLYSALTSIETSLKGTTGKGAKKHGIFETKGCKGGKWEFGTTLTYAPNPNPPAKSKSSATDEVNCKA
jgi:hypothetical protein